MKPLHPNIVTIGRVGCLLCAIQIIAYTVWADLDWKKSITLYMLAAALLYLRSPEPPRN